MISPRVILTTRRRHQQLIEFMFKLNGKQMDKTQFDPLQTGPESCS